MKCKNCKKIKASHLFSIGYTVCIKCEILLGGEKKSRYKVRKQKLTPKQQSELLQGQNGACFCCNKKPQNEQKLINFYSHISGKARALLCNKCITAIGILQEDIDTVGMMFKLLRKDNLPAKIKRINIK